MGTIRALKQEIRAVDTIIPTMKIDEFNDHVSRLITTLESHGVDMPDLMDHLFAAYRKASDNKFREHIEEVEHKWLRGEAQYDSSTASRLMADALAEYNLRVSDKSCPWGALTEEQEEILLLKAEIKRVTADSSKKKNRRVQTPTSQVQTPPSTNRDASGKTKIPTWKFDQPTNGVSKKEHKGKTYHWCPHHYDGGMWSLHEPKDCKNRATKEGTSASQVNANSESVTVDMAEDSDGLSEEELQASIAILAEDSDEEGECLQRSRLHAYNIFYFLMVTITGIMTAVTIR